MPVKLQGRAIDSNTSISINTFSIGSNINANTTTVFVGNSTINTNISAATILINGVNVNTAITSNAATAYSNATTYASNADNISSGTLNTARLPATVNVATILNVGANSFVNTSAHFVGNSTVNSILTSTTFAVGGNTATFGTAAYVVANGFVGIGTNSPSRALTIEKSGAAFPSASNPTIRLNETSSGRFAVMELDSSQNLTIWNGDAGSGSIRFYRGSGSGTLSVSIDGSGNVGIGTASPGYKLDVSGTTRVSGTVTIDNGNLTFSTNTTPTISKPSSNTTVSYRFDVGGVGGNNAINQFWSGWHFYPNDGAFSNSTPSNVFPRTSFYYSYTSATNPTDTYFNIVPGNSPGIGQGLRLYAYSSAGATQGIDIAANGNVGIGTTTPATKLQVVNGTIQQYRGTGDNNGLLVSGGDANNSYVRLQNSFATVDYGQGATAAFVNVNNNQPWYVSVSAAARLWIANTGNIGIGTTSPSNFGGTNLNINSPNNSTYASTLWVSNSYVMQALVNEASSVMSIGARSNHKLDLCTNDTTRVTIAANGNVGIGTTSPGYILDVGGTVRAGYVVLAVQDGTNEGGEIQFIGAGAYGTFQIDNYQGNARIHTLAAGKVFQVLGGNILANGCPAQVQYTSSGTRVSVNSTAFTEPSTNYRVTITPKQTNSMIKLTYFIPMSVDSAVNTLYTIRAFRILSGTTSYALTSAGGSNGSRNVIAGVTFRPNNGYDSNDVAHQTFTVIDFPGTTSACTYGFEFKRETGGAGTAYFGYSAGDSSNWGFDADIVIIAEEIGQ